MNKELKALEDTTTWELVHLPQGKKPIGCKWVFKVKKNANLIVERYKARLVTKGYIQIEGEDYTESFSPVAKVVTVRIIFALAVAHNWKVHQMNVNNAFLHDSLDEVIYMQPPPGIQLQSRGQVCLLRKSLYGLKQASRQWNNTFTNAIKDYGYKQSPK
ncbi:transmembrane signal receptor [Lithospermum erythrorhizon]|uniref:Transmembrane signal receptor n=1 Tax=Lithospermum erythrorhizon TaxID=34254 RepID=A0AAV3PYU5_LITER